MKNINSLFTKKTIRCPKSLNFQSINLPCKINKIKHQLCIMIQLIDITSINDVEAHMNIATKIQGQVTMTLYSKKSFLENIVKIKVKEFKKFKAELTLLEKDVNGFTYFVNLI